MSKSLSGNREIFDGQVVEFHQGRFTGAFEIPEETGVEIANGEQYTFMVTVRSTAPKFTTVKKTGALKRENTFKVESAILIDADEAKYMYDNMGVDVEGVNDGLIESQFKDLPSEAPGEVLESFDILSALPVPEEFVKPLDEHIEPLETKLVDEPIEGPKIIEPWKLMDEPMIDTSHKTFKVVEI